MSFLDFLNSISGKKPATKRTMVRSNKILQSNAEEKYSRFQLTGIANIIGKPIAELGFSGIRPNIRYDAGTYAESLRVFRENVKKHFPKFYIPLTPDQKVMIRNLRICMNRLDNEIIAAETWAGSPTYIPEWKPNTKTVSEPTKMKEELNLSRFEEEILERAKEENKRMALVRQANSETCMELGPGFKAFRRPYLKQVTASSGMKPMMKVRNDRCSFSKG